MNINNFLVYIKYNVMLMLWVLVYFSVLFLFFIVGKEEKLGLVGGGF